jgi:hypothetical protein
MNKKTQTKNCIICKRRIIKLSTYSKKYWKGRKYCSRACTNKGKEWTYEMRIKGGIARSGIKNGNWSGGRLRYMCKLALRRDNNTCQKCGFNKDKEIMEVDHIIPKRVSPKLNRKLSNLITLCPNCHKRKTLDDMKKYPCKWRNQYTKTE